MYKHIVPHKLTDTINYKDGYKILNILQNRNHNNIIIYGISKIGKTIVIKQILNQFFGEEKGQLIENDDINVFVHSHYYLFNCKKCQCKRVFTDYVNNIICSYNHYTNQNHYLIFDQFEEASHILQNYLKVIIEKNVSICRFLFVTNRLQNILHSIQSRCILVRVSEPSTSDKIVYMSKILTNENISYDINKLHNYCKGYTIQELINIYFFEGEGAIDMIDNIISNIIKLFSKPINIKQIKIQSNLIADIQIPYSLFLTKLISKIIETFPTKDIHTIIQMITEYELLLKKSYRDIIYLESLLIQLYKKIHD